MPQPTGSGNPFEWGHHKHQVCPICNKKGVYTPKASAIFLHNNIITYHYPKTCRYCGTIWGKMVREVR